MPPYASGLKRKANSDLPERPSKRSASAVPAHASFIGSYHASEKRLAQAKTPIERSRLAKDQKTLQSYQEASLTGASKAGETSKWLIPRLKKLHKQERVKLLDVGAISGTAYASYTTAEVDSIDLNSQSPAVKQADFMTLPLPADGEEYDVVCLSLVLNFVGSIEGRGEMLQLVAHHLKPQGLLFLVLPSACVTNSRYIDHARLTAILKKLNYAIEEQEDTPKLTYWLARWRGPSTQGKARWKKTPIEGRQKGARNNFAIVLK